MSSRFKPKFWSTRILHVAYKRPGEKKLRKDYVSVSNGRFKNKALPGATTVTHLDKKLLRYTRVRNSSLAFTWSSLYNSGYRQITQPHKNLGKIFPMVWRPQMSTPPLLLFHLFFVLTSTGSIEKWTAGQPTIFTDDPPVVVQTRNGLKGHWEVYFRVRLPSVDMPVDKASSRRIAGSSINNCCLFKHIGQTREALSLPPSTRGTILSHNLHVCIPPYPRTWVIGCLGIMVYS